MDDSLQKAIDEVKQKNGFAEAGLDTSQVGDPKPTEPEKPDPPDIFEDFDTELFKKIQEPMVKKFLEPAGFKDPEERESAYGAIGACPFSPKSCEKGGTSQCDKRCKHNPESYMDPKIKEVFDQEPWSNYCFTCGEFVPTRHHEDALDPPELVYSHTVATGYNEYRTKLSKWTMERLTGKKPEPDNIPDWKHTL